MTKHERYYADKAVAYKYRPFDNCEYILNLLEKGEVFFAPPASFNDLFDTRFPVCSADGMKIERAARTIEDARENQMAVFCLSEVPDSIPMWTYYGGNNAGICVGLRLTRCSENQYGLKLRDGEVILRADLSTSPIPAYRVLYGRKIQPYVNLDDDHHDNVIAAFEFLFNKPEQLSHEREIRVVVPRDMVAKEWPEKDFNGTVFHLDKGVIESIYLGPAFDYCKNLGVIKDLIKSNDTACSRARLYQIVPHKKYYRLEHKEIPFDYLDEFHDYMVSNYKRLWGNNG